MKIQNYLKPSTMEEAYELVMDGGQIIGGGAWLKLMPKTIVNAVDISGLDLERITESQDAIYIGSMTTLRSVELHQSISTYMGGLISDATAHIMGVTLRNIATVGGTVTNRFGFSDLLTPLLAVGASLRFYKHGVISLESYLLKPFKEKDILIEVILKKNQGIGVYDSIKKTSTDFPVINVSVTKMDAAYRVVVGARPGVAHLATSVMDRLNEAPMLNEELIEDISTDLDKDIVYGSNSRGSATYRSLVAQALVARCLKEVVL